MADQEFKISVISEADNTGFKSAGAAAELLAARVVKGNDGAELLKKGLDQAAEGADDMATAAQGASLAANLFVLGLLGSYYVVKDWADGLKKAGEENAKFKAMLEAGIDASSVTTSLGSLNDAMIQGAIGASNYARDLGKIKDAQREVKTETDAAVKGLHAQKTAVEEVRRSQMEAARADIRADSATGKISKEEEIRKLAELDERFSTEKVARDKFVRDEELKLRKQELEKTRSEAAAAEAAVPGAQEAATGASLGPIRRAKLVESMKDQVAKLEAQNAKITDEIGLPGFTNEKVEFADQVPWNEKWKSGRATVEANEGTIAQFRRQLGELDTPETESKYALAAKAAEAAKRDAEERAKQLAKRVKELEAATAEMARQNQLDDSTDSEVFKNENRARGRTSSAAIEVIKTREEKSAQDAEAKALAERIRMANAKKDDVIVSALQWMATHSEASTAQLENVSAQIKNRLTQLERQHREAANNSR